MRRYHTKEENKRRNTTWLPGEGNQNNQLEAIGTEHVVYALVPLTFCDSHCRPSNSPSPVVAQLKFSDGRVVLRQTGHAAGHDTHLGWTYHVRSRILCSPNRSVTSAGDIAGFSDELTRVRVTHPLASLACWQRPSTGSPSFRGRQGCVPAQAWLLRYGLGLQSR